MSRSLARICAYLAFVVVIAATNDQEECDKTKCPGPLMHYESLDCTPVYEKEGDCCAIEYDCDHLKERAKNKCYVNGKEYENGETLKDEDANSCDINCQCVTGISGIAKFMCAEIDCFFETKPGCYRKNLPTDCCPGEEVCPDSPEDISTCNVNGTIYKDGNYFEVSGDPNLSCTCQPGYKGENVEPFCSKPHHPYCSPDFHHPEIIFNNCVPVYYAKQSPQTSCNVFSRCQNKQDTVIRKREDDSKSVDQHDDKYVCHFGNMTMRRGDELNQATSYSSVCVKCICEVPPVPTCQRLPDSECDITKHPPFDNY